MRPSTLFTRSFTSLVLLSTAATASAAGKSVSDDTFQPPVLEGGGGGGGGGEPQPPPDDHSWREEVRSAPYYGTENWGAGVAGSAYIGGTPGDFNVFYPGHDLIVAGGGFGAFARVNGDNVGLFAIRLTGQSLSQYGTTVRGELYIGGQLVASRVRSTTIAVQQQLDLELGQTVPFFDERVNLMVGPVPVTFSASAHGDVGLHGSARLGAAGLSFDAGPFARAVLHASGAVGGEWCVPITGPCIGASAGVEVDLTLFEVSVPVRIAVSSSDLDSHDVLVDFYLTMGLELEALAGRLRVFAEAHIGSHGDRWSTTLLDWRGLFHRWDFGSGHGQYCLVGSCLGQGTDDEFGSMRK